MPRNDSSTLPTPLLVTLFLFSVLGYTSVFTQVHAAFNHNRRRKQGGVNFRAMPNIIDFSVKHQEQRPPTISAMAVWVES